MQTPQKGARANAARVCEWGKEWTRSASARTKAIVKDSSFYSTLDEKRHIRIWGFQNRVYF